MALCGWSKNGRVLNDVPVILFIDIISQIMSPMWNIEEKKMYKCFVTFHILVRRHRLSDPGILSFR